MLRRYKVPGRLDSKHSSVFCMHTLAHSQNLELNLLKKYIFFLVLLGEHVSLALRQRRMLESLVIFFLCCIFILLLTFFWHPTRCDEILKCSIAARRQGSHNVSGALFRKFWHYGVL